MASYPRPPAALLVCAHARSDDAADTCGSLR